MAQEHKCIKEKEFDKQDRRIERLEDKSNRLDNKIDEIMTLLSDNKATLSEVLTRLKRKKEDDKERNGAIQKEDERMDIIEQEQASQRTQNKIIQYFLVTLLVAFILFMIEFNYKTIIMGI